VANPEDERVERGYERADRNLNELLQELRVALPGVQVLFGFRRARLYDEPGRSTL